ncbi:MAG TPA: hypothetical protein VMT54_06105 [Candidatus Cybelea sp.]|nr:hypothetical protein [Candidatus Cybelea sp.]
MIETGMVEAGMDEIRRVLVMLEPGAGEARVPELATRIAAEISADLDALLVQDAALLAAAGLPFAREVMTATGSVRRLTPEDIEVGFQVLARKLELRIGALAGEAGLRWSFRSVCGEPLAQIVAAAPESDLLLLAAPRAARFDLDAMRQLVHQIGRPAIFLTGRRTGKPGVSMVGATHGLQEGILAAAASLARALSGELTIYAQASDAAGDIRQRQLAAVLPPDLRLRIASAGAPELAEALTSEAILIVPDRQSRPSAGDPEIA